MVEVGAARRPARVGRPRRLVGRALVTVAVVVLLGALAVQVSPWPSALLIRWVFDRGARDASAALVPFLPDDVSEQLDVVVDGDDPDARVDVFHPAAVDGTTQGLPTIVWVHGGGWVSGDKADVGNYARILASEGYTVVSVGYSIAPGHRYPTPVRQVGAALRHVVDNAADLHVDPSRIVLAGDSAGSHIASQVAAIVTDPGYADRVGIEAPLNPGQLRGLVLHCGAYDLSRVEGTGLRGWFLRTVMWSYTGTRDYVDDPVVALASVRDHVTESYPPTFLSAGNADPLLPHSVDLAEVLDGLGVEVETLFFPADHEPALNHEYQFSLDTDAGRLALERSLAFLEVHLRDDGADPSEA